MYSSKKEHSNMVLVIIIDLLLYSTTARQTKAISQQQRCSTVYISISSLSNAYIELNWLTACNNSSGNKPAIISLFSKDPSSREELHPLESIYVSNYPSGYYKTQVKFNAPILPENWEYSEDLVRTHHGKHCFPYWIVSISENGTIIDSQCFAIQPTWMSDNKESLLLKTLDSILIPGTHNSGAYEGSRLPKLIRNYVVNQDRLIWTQLVFGIRYLDLRIGYYGNEGFYINHDFIRIMPLMPALKQIKKFMELTDEIVILDFHRFPYPSQPNAEIHELLTNIIYSELGAFAYPRTSGKEGLRFEKLFAQNRRLIISYNNHNMVKDRQWLWDGIPQYWGNTINVTNLKNYLHHNIMIHPEKNQLWALMAELTPRPSDVLLLRNNLRKLADDVNRELTKWFRDEWNRLGINIVATDFFLGNDLINVAIEKIK